MAILFYASDPLPGGIDDYTKLMLHMDGADDGTTFTDDSDSGHIITRTGAVTKTGTKKFGTASGYFDGTNDLLSVPDSDDWNFGSGAWTIDFWINSSSSQYGHILNRRLSPNPWTGWYLDFNAAGGVDGDITFFTNGNTEIIRSTVEFNDGNWHHFALTDDTTNIRLFKNGILDATVASVSIENYAQALTIGAKHDASNFLLAYIDELRISKGIARWISNFTPESGPYTE